MRGLQLKLKVEVLIGDDTNDMQQREEKRCVSRRLRGCLCVCRFHFKKSFWKQRRRGKKEVFDFCERSRGGGKRFVAGGEKKERLCEFIAGLCFNGEGGKTKTIYLPGKKQGLQAGRKERVFACVMSKNAAVRSFFFGGWHHC